MYTYLLSFTLKFYVVCYKVWSDLKNNTKKKAARLNVAANATGGGPPLMLRLTDLENRVLQIIGHLAATGLGVPEAGFSQVIFIVFIKYLHIMFYL